MTIRNQGKTDDRLVSARTARAARTELVAGSSPVFAVEPGGELKLDTATGYIRLHGLTKPLYVHEDFPLTLVFAKAGRVDVDVNIEAAQLGDPKSP